MIVCGRFEKDQDHEEGDMLGYVLNLQCARCGNFRSRHDPNIVCEEDDVFEEACMVLEGYKMSLVDCVETRLPEWYLKGLKENNWFFGYEQTSGYVSGDPAEESKKYASYLAAHMQATIVMIPDYRAGCYRFSQSE